ncbi:hypothetical protein N7490_011696 [Penicillium lividum]|nr:hypothetical protein N7490_011696 [Penicillium lividum]
MAMDLSQMGAWANSAPHFHVDGSTTLLDLELELSGTASTTKFPTTRPSNGYSASLEAYVNSPKSSQPWSSLNVSGR